MSTACYLALIEAVIKWARHDRDLAWLVEHFGDEVLSPPRRPTYDQRRKAR